MVAQCPRLSGKKNFSKSKPDWPSYGFQNIMWNNYHLTTDFRKTAIKKPLPRTGTGGVTFLPSFGSIYRMKPVRSKSQILEIECLLVRLREIFISGYRHDEGCQPRQCNCCERWNCSSCLCSRPLKSTDLVDLSDLSALKYLTICGVNLITSA